MQEIIKINTKNSNSMKKDNKKITGMGKKSSVSPVSVQSYLKGMTYPAGKQEIIDCANDNDAPIDVVNLIEGIPEKTYSSPAEITKAIGQM